MAGPGDAHSADRADSNSPADKIATREIAESPVEAATLHTAVAAPSEIGEPRGIPRTTPVAQPDPTPTTRPSAARATARRRSDTEPAARPDLLARGREVVRIIGVGRVLCWQIALLAAIAAIGEPRPVAVATVAVALGVVAATAIRVRGHWLYEWLIRAGKFLFRRRHRPMQPGGEGLIDLFTPHASVEATTLDDVPVAFIHHPDGITAVLEPHVPDGESTFPVSSPVSLLPPPDAESPPLTAQLIMQMATNNAISRRRTWITLQVLRTPDIHRDTDLSDALAGAVHRLIRRLARDELPTRPLDRDEALSLIAALSQLGDSTDRLPCKETWGAWEAGDTVQACFRIHNWRDISESTRQLILQRLQLVPSLGTTVAVGTRRNDRRAEVIVRITEADRSRLDNSADLLAFAVENMVPVERLNGDHLAAIATSLPFGASLGAR